MYVLFGLLCHAELTLGQTMKLSLCAVVVLSGLVNRSRVAQTPPSQNT